MTEIYPATIPAAVSWLRCRLPHSTLSELRAMSKKDLGQCHFGLGMWIRNNIGLWTTNKALLAATAAHPDDASMVLIKALWADLQINKLEEVDR